MNETRVPSPPPPEYQVSITDAGGLTAVIVSTLGMIAFAVSKLRKMGKIDGAEGSLYDKLAAQVREQKDDLDRVYKERNSFSEQVADLKARIAGLEDCKSMITTLKDRLAEKDRILDERDAEVRRLMLEIIQLKDRIHVLELRLADDEKQFCYECPRLRPGAG